MAVSGPRPKPTHLKLVQGNPGKRPLNRREPTPARRMPTPPDYMCEEALAEWNRRAPELFSLGLLTDVDAMAFAAYCRACARLEQAETALNEMAKANKLTGSLMIKTTNGNAIQNPLIGISNKAMADIVRYAAEFGMTPSARSRIEATPEAPTDNAASYLR